MERKNPRNECWNNVVKPAVERKEVLGARDDAAKERYMEVYKKEKKKLKDAYIRIEGM